MNIPAMMCELLAHQLYIEQRASVNRKHPVYELAKKEVRDRFRKKAYVMLKDGQTLFKPVE